MSAVRGSMPRGPVPWVPPAWRSLSLLTVAAMAASGWWPWLDLQWSRQLFERMGGWVDARNALAHAVYAVWPWFTLLALGGLSSALVWGLWKRRPAMWRWAAFALCSLLLGPGLLVDQGLKNHSGRARPAAVLAQTAPYSPPLAFDGPCPRNCSFVSGHAAGAFWLAGLALPLAAGALRRRLRWAGWLFGAAMGALRMSQGGHFFFDIVFAALAVEWCSTLLYAAWYAPFLRPKAQHADHPV